MSCCVRLARSFDDRQAARQDAPGAGPLMGTWDYKWPQGTTIRVAFQIPPGGPSADFTEAKALISEIASRWHDAGAAIGFSFGIPDFAPPESREGATHPARRSPRHTGAYREYDVLVSLEPLPLVLEDTLTAGDPFRSVFLPISELGSFARRIDYGTPTIFVGPMRQVSSLASYYRSDPLARMMVLHEFGHALGLAHEHQSPVVRMHLGLKSDDYDLEKARQLLIQRLGVPAEKLPPVDPSNAEDATAAFVQSHLGLTWPGNLRFSDWRPVGPGAGAPLDSVMTVPYHDCALKPEAASRLGLPACGCGPEHCSTYDRALVDTPTASDRAFLAAMYPLQP